MVRLDETRFKKVDEILIIVESQFHSQGYSNSFTAFVDFKTWRAIEGHVRKNGYGDIKSENEINFIQFRDWKIFWLPQKIDPTDKIGILMFPSQGVYKSSE